MRNKLKEHLRKEIDYNCSVIHSYELKNEQLKEMLNYLQELIDIKSKLGRSINNGKIR